MMMWPDLQKAFDWQADLPRFVRVRQEFPTPCVGDIRQAVFQELERLPDLSRQVAGKRIAITAGSRGIAEIAAILAALVDGLRQREAQPFIVPAMGSHGGATAEGQVQVMANLGMTEASLGAPILSSMEVVELGRLSNGMPVYADRLAAEADGVVLANRIKPHTDFVADFESGLAKIATLGLGKQKGAETIHSYGVEGLTQWMPEAARLVVEKMPVLFGLATVENASHQVAHIRVVPPADIAGPLEKSLLQEAYRLMPGIPFEEVDVLIVDQMGKNISGVGMDPNVIGRVRVEGVPNPLPLTIRMIVALRLTDETHGNASGIGLADVTTRQLFDQIDFETTYLNCLTAGICGIRRGFLPIVAPNDKAAIESALRCCGQPFPKQARVLRIKNTLSLEQMDVSEALLANPIPGRALFPGGPAFELSFNPDGSLPAFREEP
jgi:hypothetical protein